MSAITTHVLDTALGRPATGVPVSLEYRSATGEWKVLGTGVTDTDGRVKALLSPDARLHAGVYRLIFDTGAYQQGFHPSVTVTFRVDDPAQHYHIPLLLSPYGYTTYRGR